MKGNRFADYAVFALALGVAFSITILTVGIVWTAVRHGNTASSLTENETQVLISSFSGIFGVVGAYVGYQLGNGKRKVQPHSHVDEDTLEQWPQPGGEK